MGSIAPGNDFYKIIVENSTDTIYVMGFDEKIKYISPSVMNLFGFTPAEVIGKKIQHFMTPQSYEKQKLGMQKVIAEKRFDAAEKLIVRIFRKDGSKIWVEIHARFIIGKTGRPEAVIGVARDVSDRVKVEEDLIRKIEKLEEIN